MEPLLAWLLAELLLPIGDVTICTNDSLGASGDSPGVPVSAKPAALVWARCRSDEVNPGPCETDATGWFRAPEFLRVGGGECIRCGSASVAEWFTVLRSG